MFILLMMKDLNVKTKLIIFMDQRLLIKEYVDYKD